MLRAASRSLAPASSLAARAAARAPALAAVQSRCLAAGSAFLDEADVRRRRVCPRTPKHPRGARKILRRLHARAQSIARRPHEKLRRVPTRPPAPPPAQVSDRVMGCLKSFPKVDPTKVTSSAHFLNDLGLDSLDTVEVVMSFEDEFAIEIPDADAEKITSCDEAIKYIVQHPHAK
jgi:acyl carrier protein